MELVLINKDNIVDYVVSISDDQYDVVKDMYPEHRCIARIGDETIGYIYTGNGFIPPASLINKSYTSITNYAFLNRFTDEEAIRIDLASQGSTVEAAMMRRVQKKIDAAKFIDLSDPDTRNGVNALEQFGLLDIGRASIILDSPIQDKEHYVVGL